MNILEGQKAIIIEGIYTGLAGTIERAYSASHILLKLSSGKTIATILSGLIII